MFRGFCAFVCDVADIDSRGWIASGWQQSVLLQLNALSVVGGIPIH